MAIRVVNGDYKWGRNTNIQFPTGIVATGCKKQTHLYLEYTKHGVEYHQIRMSDVQIGLWHKYCVRAKSNDVELLEEWADFLAERIS